MDAIAAKDVALADLVAEAALDHYQRLPKKGKPHGSEWTVLAALVLTHERDLPKRSSFSRSSSSRSQDSPRPVVVALGTGNKCVGVESLSTEGDVLYDMHAETIARRAFNGFLLNQVSHETQGKSGLPWPFFNSQSLKEGRLHKSPDVNVHMYVSQQPCGDASVYPPEINIRTGSRPVPAHATQERREESMAAIQWDKPGLLRYKPGRGGTNFAMSCSDKLARWNVLGLQGSLLSLIMDPIYLDSLIISDLAYRASLQRAVIDRNELVKVISPFRLNKPALYTSQLSFIHGRVAVERQLSSVTTSSTSINFIHGDDVEVTSVPGGKLMGTTARNYSSPQRRSRLCTAIMFSKFQRARSTLRVFRKSEECTVQAHSYSELKKSAVEYEQAKKAFLESSYFSNWQHSANLFDTPLTSWE